MQKVKREIIKKNSTERSKEPTQKKKQSPLQKGSKENKKIKGLNSKRKQRVKDLC